MKRVAMHKQHAVDALDTFHFNYLLKAGPEDDSYIPTHGIDVGRTCICVPAGIQNE